jgi:hypothetical protein
MDHQVDPVREKPDRAPKKNDSLFRPGQVEGKSSGMTRRTGKADQSAANIAESGR